MKILSLLCIFSFGCLNLIAEKHKQPSELEFQSDIESLLPGFDFRERDLYKILAFLQLRVSSLRSFYNIFKKLNDLQLKYYADIQMVRIILFLKYALSYIHMDPAKYSITNQQYLIINSSNFIYAKHIQKLTFLFRYKFYSNNSKYCLRTKINDYYFLKENGITDDYINLLYELMIKDNELIDLKNLLHANDSWYGMSWVESVWQSSFILKDGISENLDVYYYNLIKFFVIQNLKEEAYCLYEEMSSKCSDSKLLVLSSKFFA